MMNSPFSRILIFCCLLMLCTATNASAQFDISSGGAPTITGASGGTVAGSSIVTNNLAVTVNFGEVSPVNTNNFVRVVIPIGIRSSGPYQVAVTTSAATFSGNLQALQRSDIGVGALGPLRAMGARSRVCANPHTFTALYNNDPSVTATLNASGRTTYPSSLAGIAGSTVILSGPRLTSNAFSRRDDNGYVFDVVLAIKPQFYVAGSFNVTLNFTISTGPNVTC